MRKKVKNHYKQVLQLRPEQSVQPTHHNRISLQVGDAVDPSRYNASFFAKSKILEPAIVMDIKHDDKNWYYTQVELACESGPVWLGQNWLEWEGKRKV